MIRNGRDKVLVKFQERAKRLLIRGRVAQKTMLGTTVTVDDVTTTNTLEVWRDKLNRGDVGHLPYQSHPHTASSCWVARWHEIRRTA